MYDTIVFLSNLCIIFLNSDIDCSYSFYEYSEYNSLVQSYYIYGGNNLKENNYINGFVEHNVRIMFLSPHANIDTILHEIKHIQCYNEYQRTGKNHDFCVDESKHFMYGVRS